MADIFREVDEEVRKDKALGLWKRYGSYVIVACVALVLGTAGRVAWREYTRIQQKADAEAFAAATQLAEQGDAKAATAAFDTLSNDASTGYAVIAAFRAAEQRTEAGEKDAAVAIYDRLANDSDADAPLQALARLFAAMLLLDGAPAADVKARLDGLDADDSPWRYSARELSATLSYRDGDLAAAKTRFKALGDDPAAPNGIRARAQEMLSAMGEDQ